MNILRRFGAALKAAGASFVMNFGISSGVGGLGGWRWNGDPLQADYRKAVGNGRGNSIIAATLGWMGRKFPNGVLSLRTVNDDGTKDPVPKHPFLTLMRHPTRFTDSSGRQSEHYSGSTMMRAALADWTITGDAYLLKMRNSLDGPVQLWYAPSFMVEPVSNDPEVFVEFYRYTPGGKRFDVRVEDVVHLRNGIDPDNPRKGLSPIGAIIRELFTDDEAAVWTAAMLKNSGAPSVVISPADGSEITPQSGQGIKDTYQQRFGGGNRGAPLVLTSKIKLERLSFSPQEMNLRAIRQTPEERVTAVLGVAAIVVGMGAGLDSATYNNLGALREAAIEDNLVPTYQDFAEQLHAQLLVDFEPTPDAFEVYYDISEIRELQPDQDKLAERETRKFLAGGTSLNEYRENTGEKPLADGDVFYVPVSAVPTRLDQLVPDMTPAAPAPAPAAPAPPPTTAAGATEVETKAIGVMNAIVALRSRLLTPETSAIGRLLRKQRDLALSVLDDVAKDADLDDLEQKTPDAEAFQRRLEARLESTFNDATGRELRRLHLRSALAVHDVVEEWAAVDIPVDARLRQRYLREAGKRVVGITDHTLRALANTIRASVFAGESLEETAARIEGLGVFSEARARTIARTELAIATNRAAITTYEEAGTVTHVRIHDGTQHDEPCASLAGRVVTLEDAAGIPEVEHPNCVRAFEPLIRAKAEHPTNGHVERRELVTA